MQVQVAFMEIKPIFKVTTQHLYPVVCATKRSNELIAHALFPLQNKYNWTRFFTVYGPWGRPDMSLLITKILATKN